jgi:hypothetical protein
VKPKKCKICGIEFIPQTTIASVCSYSCAVELTNKRIDVRVAKEQKNAVKERREALVKLKTRAEWMKEVQQAFNAYIRARDYDKNCISSGVGNISYIAGIPKQTAWDAGHYRTVGSCPELRFEPLNCHKQRVHDNQHLHGNIVEYRKGLIERIGIEKVEWLEGPHKPKKYTIEDLKQIKAKYKLKLKELLKNGKS